MVVIEAVTVAIAVAGVDSAVASKAMEATGAAFVVAETNYLGEDLEDAVVVLDFMVVVVLLTASQMAMELRSQLRVALVDLLVEASEVVEDIVETSNAKVPVGMMIVRQNVLGTKSSTDTNVLGSKVYSTSLVSHSPHQARAGVMIISLGSSILQVLFMPSFHFLFS
jgi:hypothetical protein